MRLYCSTAALLGLLRCKKASRRRFRVLLVQGSLSRKPCHTLLGPDLPRSLQLLQCSWTRHVVEASPDRSKPGREPWHCPTQLWMCMSDCLKEVQEGEICRYIIYLLQSQRVGHINPILNIRQRATLKSVSGPPTTFTQTSFWNHPEAANFYSRLPSCFSTKP